MSLEDRVRALEDLEAIKRVKFAYWRGLDQKRWDVVGDCFAVDAVADYMGRRFEGRDAIRGFLEQTLGAATGMVTVHHGHQPEIELTGPDSARGTWALDNDLLHPGAGRHVKIAAWYHDEYVRVGGAWKIRHSAIEVLVHEEWSRSDLPSLRLVVPNVRHG